MAILKIIEVLASSKDGWEDAAKKAVEQASKTVKNIRSVYIKDQSATVKDGKIIDYRVNVKITFEVSDS
ncbi:dodecin family protein [Arenibacter latericius]|uniref:dodecin family protein n=1 Tax=Arenibacter latericius TaxID=86104 RepID=UPI0003F721E1|nr:dodecin family protein [Arenibacter latericius]MDX1365378.1 dodecin family protein [Arenibacter latericius]